MTKVGDFKHYVIKCFDHFKNHDYLIKIFFSMKFHVYKNLINIKTCHKWLL